MSTLTKARVLIVEDERIVALDLQQTLASLGYDAYAVASSAAEAVRHVTRERPDVVLMDIRIKGDLDGVGTATLLHQRFDLPVIFLTAHADDATIRRAAASYPYGYLLKPVKATELRSAIEITMHRSALERRLRDSERWFVTTLHSIDEGVLTAGLDGRITFINAMAKRMLGESAAEFIGRPAHEVLRLTDSAGRPMLMPLEGVIRDSKVASSADAVLQCQDGTSVAVMYSASPVDRDGELIGAVMTFRDVTQQRLMQQQLELTDRLASLGTMAAGVAHEINNPLAVIVGNARFAQEHLQKQRETPGSEQAIEALSDLRNATERISTITADLQVFARRKPRKSQPVDVRAALDWALRSTTHALRMKSRVVVEIGDLPLVVGDEHRLGQVFVNLLINASHAIADGEYSKNTVAIRGRALDREHVLIEVSDTGSGMPAAILQRIFEPFFTTKGPGVGTGLGLSICHGIIGEFGGTISARSVVGSGTTFAITLRTALENTREATPHNQLRS